MRMFILTGLVLALVPRAAFAISADPNPAQYVQPGGIPITVTKHGDEYWNWEEDDQGYLIVRDASDTYTYAQVDPFTGQIVSTGAIVGTVDPRTLGLVPHIIPPNTGGRFPPGGGPGGLSVESAPTRTSVLPTGTVKNLVILALFSDHTVAANGRLPSAYDSLLNQVLSTGPNAPTGSVRDYYYEASYGTMTLNSTVVAWVTLPNTQAYYANNNNGSGPSYPRDVQGMVEDALNLADPLVNFGDFDTDNDGWVDAIDIIHSGYGGENSGAPKSWIWSQRWNLGELSGGKWTSADVNGVGTKVQVSNFHTEPALWGKSGNGVTHIGVICHETGHFFGLPDLYDTDYSSAGIGNWCVMANSWGWDGTQLHPPHFSAWCKTKLGWVTPDVITAPGTYTATRVETHPTIWEIPLGSNPKEYLLIENREPFGFDSQIPQGGLAIWHIDDNVGGNMNEGFPGQSGWPTNGKHYEVALLQADGNYSLERNMSKGDSTDLYRLSGVRRLDERTVPSSDVYAGVFHPTGSSVVVNSDPAFNMTFTYQPAVWVSFGAPGPFYFGTFDLPYPTIASGVANCQVGGIVICKTGVSNEHPTLSKALTVKTWNGVTTIGP